MAGSEGGVRVKRTQARHRRDPAKRAIARGDVHRPQFAVVWRRYDFMKAARGKLKLGISVPSSVSVQVQVDKRGQGRRPLVYIVSVRGSVTPTTPLFQVGVILGERMGHA